MMFINKLLFNLRWNFIQDFLRGTRKTKEILLNMQEYKKKILTKKKILSTKIKIMKIFELSFINDTDERILTL